jgi:chitin disaccharide deacetylase
VAKPRIIITGDDLGLSEVNNAGIVAAHVDGILTTTCLMPGGDAAEEGIAIARRYRSLAVGLHVAFADVRPVLPPERVDRLVGTDGRFPPNEHLLYRALLTQQGRQQVRAEIAAQFDAFGKTGLLWDHVNTHRHVHRHPYIAFALFREATARNVKRTRIPWDPPADPLRAARAVMLRRFAGWHGLATPDRSIGRDWSVGVLLALLATLPADSIAEIYFHPVTTADHAFAADLPTLLHPEIRLTLLRVRLCSGLREALE